MKRPPAHPTTPPTLPTDWGRWLAPLLSGLLPLLVYVRTLAPTVTAEDSGELISAANCFGIPHPPGYPLWTLLCGVFVHIAPFGSVALRANLFSAVCSSLAAVVTYAALRELSVSRAAAVGAAMTWVLTRWAWKQSVITEVYSLNALLTAGFLWAILRWHRTRQPRALFAASLMAGLGMSNHLEIAFAVLAGLIWVLALQTSLLRRGRFCLQCLGCFAVGLVPYLYMPIRAAADPPMNWGNPRTLSAAWNHVARKQYGAVGPRKSYEPRSRHRFADQLRYSAGALVDDLSWPGAAATAIGSILLLRRGKRSWLALAILWVLCNVVLFVWISNFDLDRTPRWLMRVFFIPAHAGLILAVAALLDWLVSLRGLRVARWPVGLALPVWLVAAFFQDNDYSNYWLAHDHATNLLACMQENALVFTSGDHITFPLTYLTDVDRARPDVVLAQKYAYLDPALYKDRPADSQISPLRWVMTRHHGPIYYSGREELPVANGRLDPAGLVYRLVSSESPVHPAGLWDQLTYRNFSSPTLRDLGGDQILAQYYFFGGLDALQAADVSKATERFDAAARYGWGCKEVINNIGVAWGEAGQEDAAVRYCKEAAALDPHWDVPRWNLFGLYERRHDAAAMRVVVKEILASDPNDSHARAALDRLEAGPVSMTGGTRDTASSTQPHP